MSTDQRRRGGSGGAGLVARLGRGRLPKRLCDGAFLDQDPPNAIVLDLREHEVDVANGKGGVDARQLAVLVHRQTAAGIRQFIGERGTPLAFETLHRHGAVDLVVAVGQQANVIMGPCI